jgi:hypothetical protein
MPPAIVSISYDEAETLLGAAENLAFKTLYQTAAGEGVSVFVAAGDWIVGRPQFYRIGKNEVAEVSIADQSVFDHFIGFM